MGCLCAQSFHTATLHCQDLKGFSECSTTMANNKHGMDNPKIDGFITWSFPKGMAHFGKGLVEGVQCCKLPCICPFLYFLMSKKRFRYTNVAMKNQQFANNFSDFFPIEMDKQKMVMSPCDQVFFHRTSSNDYPPNSGSAFSWSQKWKRFSKMAPAVPSASFCNCSFSGATWSGPTDQGKQYRMWQQKL